MSFYYKIRNQIYPTLADRPRDYTPQFRLECKARTVGSDSQSLAMRVADPLWMLGRQWQFGEFQGEDNGSPINVSTFTHKENLNYYSLGGSSNKSAIGGIPLEARVEAMPLFNDLYLLLDIKSMVRVGRKFEKLIRQHTALETNQDSLIKKLRATSSSSSFETIKKMDNSSVRFLNLMKGKVIDGGWLIQSFAQNNIPWKNWGDVTRTTQKALDDSARKLFTWFFEFYVKPNDAESAWQDSNLAHHFKLHDVKNSNYEKIKLNAPDYQAGHLDWYSFDTADVKKDMYQSNKSKKDLLPVNVSLPSMPNKRLFSFEDSKMDMTKMNFEPGDLIKAMLLDFSLVSGLDWYTIPIKMKPGDLCWVEKIEVKDVFQVTTTITNNNHLAISKNKEVEQNGTSYYEGGDGRMIWDMFKIRSNDDEISKADNHFLFIAPAVSKRMESEPLEELLFVRDEYANMVWAIEKRITNGMGKVVDGYDLHLDLAGEFIKPKSEMEGESYQYRMASTVPFNWIPFLPKHIGGQYKEIELHKAMMVKNEDSNEPEDIEPLTWLLTSNDIKKVREEAIPRAGVRVQVTNQRVRWTDGKTFVWRGRKVLVGRGEGNSGLRFDYLK